jgi:hypothetical protein
MSVTFYSAWFGGVDQEHPLPARDYVNKIHESGKSHISVNPPGDVICVPPTPLSPFTSVRMHLRRLSGFQRPLPFGFCILG